MLIIASVYPIIYLHKYVNGNSTGQPYAKIELILSYRMHTKVFIRFDSSNSKATCWLTNKSSVLIILTVTPMIIIVSH